MQCIGPTTFSLRMGRLSPKPYRLTGSPDTQPAHDCGVRVLRTSPSGRRPLRVLRLVTAHSFEPLCTSSIPDQTQDFVLTLQSCMPFLNALVGALRPSEMHSPQARAVGALAVTCLQQILGLTACTWLFVNGVNVVATHAPTMCAASPLPEGGRTAQAAAAQQQRKPHCVINLASGPMAVSMPCQSDQGSKDQSFRPYTPVSYSPGGALTA